MKFFNKDPDIVLDEAHIIILDSRYSVCSDNNGKDTNHTSHISRRVNFVQNGEKCKMHNIDSCEVGLQLVDIENNNVEDNDLNTIMKYIMVSINN